MNDWIEFTPTSYEEDSWPEELTPTMIVKATDINGEIYETTVGDLDWSCGDWCEPITKYKVVK